MNFRRAFIFGLVLTFVFVLAGCSAPAKSPAISLDSAWGRPSPSIAGAGAIFVTVKNTGSVEDKISAAKSAACGMAELHESVKKADGTMGMNLITEPIVVPAGGQVELKAGGKHIMCMKMDQAVFKPGNKVDVTLVFDKSGEKTFSAEIRAQ